MVDGPFDYSSWKTVNWLTTVTSIRALGNDTLIGIVMEVNVHEESDVYVDIKNVSVMLSGV
jgi:hypothetical protein